MMRKRRWNRASLVLTGKPAAANVLILRGGLEAVDAGVHRAKKLLVRTSKDHGKFERTQIIILYGVVFVCAVLRQLIDQAVLDADHRRARQLLVALVELDLVADGDKLVKAEICQQRVLDGVGDADGRPGAFAALEHVVCNNDAKLRARERVRHAEISRAVCLRRNFAEHEIDFAVSQRLETGLVGFKGDELNFKVIGLGDRREHIHMHSGARAVRLLKLKRRRVRVETDAKIAVERLCAWRDAQQTDKQQQSCRAPEKPFHRQPPLRMRFAQFSDIYISTKDRAFQWTSWNLDSCAKFADAISANFADTWKTCRLERLKAGDISAKIYNR